MNNDVLIKKLIKWFNKADLNYITCSKLYEKYKKNAEARGLKVMDKRKFGMKVKELGVERKRIRKQKSRVWVYVPNKNQSVPNKTTLPGEEHYLMVGWRHIEDLFADG